MALTTPLFQCRWYLTECEKTAVELPNKIDVPPCAGLVVVVVKPSCPCLDVKNSIIAARCAHDPAIHDPATDGGQKLNNCAINCANGDALTGAGAIVKRAEEGDSAERRSGAATSEMRNA